MLCKKCSLPIDFEPDTFTACRGRCSQRFHAHCVELTADTVRALKCRNVIWLCDDCLIEFGSMRYREVNDCMDQQQPTKLIEDVTELKAQVAEIIDMLSNGKSKIPTENSFLRLHSTPVSSVVSSEMPSRSHTKNDRSITQSDHLFSLMLSNIDNRVTDKDISLLVAQSLGTTDSDNVRVTKLVSKWKACDEMDYVSFKVVLDEKWKNAALSTSTWPKEIRYREFVNRRSVTWFPMS